MSNETTTKPKIVEVSFGISKTVQKKQFEPIKLFSTVTIAAPDDYQEAGEICFNMVEAEIDRKFMSMGLTMAPVTDFKQEVIIGGEGSKGEALERRQDRREPAPPPQPEDDLKPELLVNKNTEEFAAARDKAHEMVAANPERWTRCEETLHRLKEAGEYPRSVAHIKYLRSQKKIEYVEYKRLMDFLDVLQLPEKVPKKVDAKIDIAALVQKHEIKSYKHAGYLRSQDKLDYQEYKALQQIYKDQGDSIFVVTA